MDGLLGSQVGRYRVSAKIGEGGMGVVYQGIAPDGRPVAVKVLRPHVAGDPDARRRLAREVDTLRRVRHPRVAEVLEADVDGRLPYVVTRFVPGPPLDEYIQNHGPMGDAALVRLGRGLGDALATIHGAGVVHRDLKPGNVLMLDGDPVVIDFGIAHVADDARLTSTGLVMGTPGYLSPELLEGEAVSAATDWWGWAATLVFAATGRAPFGRGPLEAVLDRVRRGAADLDGVPAGLAPTLGAALSPDPAQRPRPGALRRALDDAGAGLGADTGTIAVGRLDHRAGRQVPGTPPPAGQSHPGQGSAAPLPAEQVPATRALPDQPRPTRVLPAEPRPLPQQQAPVAAPGQPFVAPEQGRPDGRSGQPGWGQPGWGQSAAGPGSQVQPYHRAGTIAGHQGGPIAGQPGLNQSGPGQPGSPNPVRPPSARSGTVFVSFLTFVVLAVAAPVFALVFGGLWSVVARTVERSRYSLFMRRHQRGPRSGDAAGAVARSPLYLVGSLFVTIGTLIPPTALGVCAYFATQILVPTDTPGLLGLVPMAAGSVVAWGTAWWGPGGGNLRRGSRAVVRGVAPGLPGAVIAITVMSGAAVVAAYALQTNDWNPDWFPLTQAPWSFLRTWFEGWWPLG